MEHSILVGWGQADITPKGGPISLIGQWQERISDIVRDPLQATAIVVESGDQRVIWVACDLLHITRPLTEAVRALLRDSVPSFHDEQLILSATHIHTGPNTDEHPFTTLLEGRGDPPSALPTAECRRQIALGIRTAVVHAMESMQESTFGLALSPAITGVNRRATYADGTAVMYGDIHRPDFRGMEGRDGGPIQILYVRNTGDNALTGIVAAVPCTAQCDEMGLYITADYWGAARGIIKAHFGEHVGVLGLIRSSGDLSPHAMVDRTREANRIYGADGAQLMGKRVARAVIDAVADVAYTTGPCAAFAHLCSNEAYPIWTATHEQYEWAKEYRKAHDPALGKLEDMMAFSRAAASIKRHESPVKTYPCNLHVVRLGDIVLCTTPFELFIEYTDRIRAACPEATVIDVQLAGDEALGYLATQKAIDGGGYSAMIFSGLFDAQVAERIVAKCIGMIHAIMKE